MPGLFVPQPHLIKPRSGVIDWSHPLARGLVECFLLTEGAGKIARNLASPTRVGTLASSVTWGIDRQGIVASFPGSTNQGITHPNYTFGTKFTLELMIHPTTITGSFVPLYTDSGNSYGMYIDTSDLDFGATGNQYASAGLAAGGYFHVVLTHDNGGPTDSWYVNGVAKSSGAGGGTFTTPIFSNIGAVSGSGYNGTMGWFRAWDNRILTAAEAFELYHAPFDMIVVERPATYAILGSFVSGGGGGAITAQAGLGIGVNAAAVTVQTAYTITCQAGVGIGVNAPNVTVQTAQAVTAQAGLGIGVNAPTTTLQTAQAIVAQAGVGIGVNASTTVQTAYSVAPQAGLGIGVNAPTVTVQTAYAVAAVAGLGIGVMWNAPFNTGGVIQAQPGVGVGIAQNVLVRTAMAVTAQPGVGVGVNAASLLVLTAYAMALQVGRGFGVVANATLGDATNSNGPRPSGSSVASGTPSVSITATGTPGGSVSSNTPSGRVEDA